MLRKRILSILFWSVVSAAFIGPGTITTATKAGVFFNFQLLWALVFSTFATLLLQEASARLAINSKLNLGEAISKKFEGKSSRTLVLFIIIVAIVLGCAAYETGNILGAVAGLKMIFDIPAYYFVAGIGALAILIFLLDSVHKIAKLMGLVVFMMGAAFLFTSISLKPDWGQVLHGSVVPIIPEGQGAALIIIALIGTTVIPYDLFLGSGALDKKQSIKDMRFGLAFAIIFGGIISMSIMGVGNAITEAMSEIEKTEFLSNLNFNKDGYTLLTGHLQKEIGMFAVYIFGFGMFAAGFSSAVTSPLASAITAKSLFTTEKNKKKWSPNKLYFKLVIGGVLAVGLIFGFMEIKPIPAIIIAQAFNGLILPLIAVFLIYVVNDPEIIGEDNLNGWISNILMGIVLWVTMILGFANISQSVAKTLGYNLESTDEKLMIPVIIISFLISAALLWKIYKKRIKLVEQRL
ncbi:MAG: divalent metal cation transporter [Bacteroidales bacterium]|nr:divalent metal cation transporter [Bacteroidales bacterium]